MATDWFYYIGDQRLGPVGSQQLKDLAKAGDLQPNSLVWKEGMSKPQPASKVKGLFDPSAKLPPLPPEADELPITVRNPKRPIPPPLPMEAVVEPNLDFLSSLPVSSPSKTSTGGSRRLVKIVVGIAATLLLLGGLGRISSLGQDKNIAIVKEGHFQTRPQVTIGHAVDDFMGNPRWDSGVSDDGLHFVNVRGQVKYLDKPVEALLQFQVSRNSTTFEVHALEFNGIPQPPFVVAAFLMKMVDGK